LDVYLYKINLYIRGITLKPNIVENIKRLKKVSDKLLRASNVSFIVISGLQLDKRVMIEKAQREAKEVLKYRDFLSRDSIIELQNILDL